MFFRYSNRGMTLSDAAKARYIDAQALEPVVKSFVNAKILDEENKLLLYNKSCVQAEVIDEIARVYRERPHAVVNFIYSSPMRSFSDAFSLRAREGED